MCKRFERAVVDSKTVCFEGAVCESTIWLNKRDSACRDHLVRTCLDYKARKCDDSMNRLFQLHRSCSQTADDPIAADVAAAVIDAIFAMFQFEQRVAVEPPMWDSSQFVSPLARRLEQLAAGGVGRRSPVYYTFTS